MGIIMPEPESKAEQCAYLRINRNTRKAAAAHFAEHRNLRRFVVSATGLASTPTLTDAFTGRSACEIILDTECAEAAAPAFADHYRGKLGWMPKIPEVSPAEMTQNKIYAAANSIAEFTSSRNIDVVISPSHLLGEQGEPWLQVDTQSCLDLRKALDGAGQSAVKIDYALLAPLARLEDPAWQQEICAQLAPLPFRQLWIRVGPYGIGHGRNAGLVAEAAGAFRKLGRPIVLDYAGGMTGLTPLIFGHADGTCHGVSSKLECNFLDWMRKPSSGPPSPGGRRNIYHPGLERMVTKSEHRALGSMTDRHRRPFSCVDSHCCASNNHVLQDPLGHFLRQVTETHRDLLTLDPIEGQKRLHKRLWENERTIKLSLQRIQESSLCQKLLSDSASDLLLLRNSLPLATPHEKSRMGLPFDGQEPTNRGLILQSPGGFRPVEPDFDLFE